MQYVIENFEYFIGIIPDLFFLLFVLFLPIVLLFKHSKRAGLKSCWYFLCSLLPSGRFHFYYITDNDIKADPKAYEVARICQQGYVDPYFDEVYKCLSEFNLPSHFLINWTRSIAEDLQKSSMPITQIEVWNKYLDRVGTKLLHTLHPILGNEFAEHEKTYLWGAVYYWIKHFSDCVDKAEILENIERQGVAKPFTRPYFDLFRNWDKHIEQKTVGSVSARLSAPKLETGERLGIDERIIFVSTALGITLDASSINQTQLSKMISHFSGDDDSSIRSRIVALNKELNAETMSPGKGLSAGTKEAVDNVISWLGKVGKGGNSPATKKLIDEVKDQYLNRLE